MSRIIKRPGRKGYYLQVPVPRDLRQIFKTSSLVRKLSNSKNESLKIREEVELKIKNKFVQENHKLKSKYPKNKTQLKQSLDINFDHIFFKEDEFLNEKALILSFWHCIGHVVDFEKQGSYSLIKFFDIEVIIHNYKGNFWAFENSCPHRGTKFFKKDGEASKISCPYHGWAFDPGSSYIPRKDTFDNLEDLNKIRPKIWQIKVHYGFIFISYKPLFEIKMQLGEKVSKILKLIGKSIFKKHSTQYIKFNSNWKIAIENSLEPYHVSLIHKDSLAKIGIDDGENNLYNWASILNHQISSSRIKKSNKLIRKMLNILYEFEGYWSLYLFPFAMISSTESLTFSHQFYQPTKHLEVTECITKLWCLQSKNNSFDNALNSFYDNASKLNLKIFKEDAEICSQIPSYSWNTEPLKYQSSLEIKINHFRECMRNFNNIATKEWLNTK
ncbi:Rieske 2Fe-2S domain-containing protein [Prochlorococcus sp. AH-716-B04]|nr:Rieske 2Fe-2S domain-containing protein [Prochlorococcus sp. AH-716-B04]